MPIVVITLLGAALRFFYIGHQGFWLDEAYTVDLVMRSPGRMLGLLPHLESTPPLYYCVAWVWTRIFGFGPAGVKSLSALCGTLTIPVAYAAGRKLLPSPRAALIVAALTAFNPFLIWYSQEARAYSMLVLLSACTVLAFAYALERPRALSLALWALACVLALLTHYYALIVIVPEAVWLLYEHRRSRAVQLGIAGVVAGGLALLPLAITQTQTHNNRWIARSSYLLRLRQIVPLFVTGPETHARRLLEVLGIAMLAAAVAFLIWRSRRRERQGALLPGGIALAGFLLAAVVGHNTLLARNLLPIWLPAALFIAAGLGAARAGYAGVAATVVLCAIGLTAVVSVNTTEALQRPNWQPVAQALGPWPQPGGSARDARIVVVQYNPSVLPLGLYMKGLRYARGAAIRHVTAIDVIAVDHGWLGAFCWWGSICNLIPSHLARDYRVPGFHAVATKSVGHFRILELRASRPQTVGRDELPSARTGNPPLLPRPDTPFFYSYDDKHRFFLFLPPGDIDVKDGQFVQQS